jgi:signal transduction histidine kinase
MALAGLVASISIGLLVRHLLVRVGLHFALAHLSVALITGGGSAYVGWQWDKLSTNRHRLARIGLVAAVVMLLLIGVWLVDREVTSLLVAQGRQLVMDIPGVRVVAVDGHRGIRTTNVPSYGAIAVLYMMAVGLVSGFSSRMHTTFRARQREVDDLRDTLLGQVQATAAQQERNRLARELHDSIKQQIFSISMSAAAAEAHWESDPQRAQTALADLRDVAHEAMVEMNALLQQLSPAPLEKVGLVQALRDQCEALGYRTGAQVTAEFGELSPNDRLPAGAQESIFRIVQEAFSNIARHARAGKVSLSLGLRDDDEALLLRIRDDGQGFSPEDVDDGMGLDNIRQRVNALKGDLSISSGLNEGTEMQVTVPLVRSSTREGDAAHRQYHTLNKVCLVGLAGGLVLIATLFYPLYVVLPGDLVEGWMGGSQLLSLALEIAAVLLVVATGFLAARWSGPGNRQTGAFFGALAGGVAGIVGYLGIGAAAAGVVGSGTLLRHGLVPVIGEGELAHLVVGTTIGVVWWSHIVFWAALLAGVGLGTVGGLLAPVVSTPSNLRLRPAVRMMLVPGIWTNTLLLVFTVMVFPLLEETIQSTIASQAVPLDTILPPQSISLWSIGSAAVFFLVPLAVLYLLSRSDVDAKDRATLDTAQATAVVFGLLLFGIASYLLIVSPGLSISLSSPLGIVLIVTAAACLVLGGGYLSTYVKVRRQRRSLGFEGPPPVLQIVAAIGALWGLVMIAWGVNLPLPWGMVVGLIVAVASLALLVALRRQPRQPSSSITTLERLQSTASQMVNTGVGTAVALIAPLAPIDCSGASLLTIMTRANAVLAGLDGPGQSGVPGFSMADLVRDAYLAQARLAVIMLVGSVVAVGLLMLAISGIIAFVKHRISKDS